MNWPDSQQDCDSGRKLLKDTCRTERQRRADIPAQAIGLGFGGQLGDRRAEGPAYCPQLPLSVLQQPSKSGRAVSLRRYVLRTQRLFVFFVSSSMCRGAGVSCATSTTVRGSRFSRSVRSRAVLGRRSSGCVRSRAALRLWASGCMRRAGMSSRCVRRRGPLRRVRFFGMRRFRMRSARARCCGMRSAAGVGCTCFMAARSATLGMPGGVSPPGRRSAAAVISTAAIAYKAVFAPAVAVAPSSPRPHAQEDAVVEVARPIKSHGRAGIRRVIVVAVRAHRLNSDID